MLFVSFGGPVAARGAELNRDLLFETVLAADESSAPIQRPATEPIVSPAPQMLHHAMAATAQPLPPAHTPEATASVIDDRPGAVPVHCLSRVVGSAGVEPPPGGVGGGARASKGGIASTGDGAASLFGLEDRGQRVVYVIDCSASMADHQRLALAKSELMRSLRRLTPVQQFQVILASSVRQRPLATGARPMFRGTDIDRQAAARQLAGFPAEGGTDHQRAILAALELRPDVVFYVSDGGEPNLSSVDLQVIRRANTGARIHCVQIGAGPGPDLPESHAATRSMSELARLNGGDYTYREVE